MPRIKEFDYTYILDYEALKDQDEYKQELAIINKKEQEIREEKKTAQRV